MPTKRTKNQKVPKLRPCPFCGNPAELQVSKNYWGGELAWVSCMNAGCWIEQNVNHGKEKAIKAWNYRQADNFITYLLDEIKDQPCECTDEYGKILPTCWRCKALKEGKKFLGERK